jgi:hypothetical protein
MNSVVLRDPLLLYNRKSIWQLTLRESVLNSGGYLKRTQVRDVSILFQTGPGAIINPLKAEATNDPIFNKYKPPQDTTITTFKQIDLFTKNSTVGMPYQ